MEPGGGRKVRDFGSKEKAPAVFEEVAKAVALGRPDALSWSPQERAEFDAALRALEGTGFGLMQATDLFATAVRRLPAGSNLLEAVDEFARRHPANAERRTVAELIEDAGRRNLSPGHLRDMPQRLNPFAEAFQCQIASVEAPAVKRYLDNLRGVNGQALSARSRKNAHRLICNLFNFARRQRYVPRELAEEAQAVTEGPSTDALHLGRQDAPTMHARGIGPDFRTRAPFPVNTPTETPRSGFGSPPPGWLANCFRGANNSIFQTYAAMPKFRPPRIYGLDRATEGHRKETVRRENNDLCNRLELSNSRDWCDLAMESPEHEAAVLARLKAKLAAR